MPDAPDPAWAKVYRSFDAISPWDAGRYRDDAGMDRLRKSVWEGDLAESKDLGKGYMPTAFPGSRGTTCARTAGSNENCPPQGRVILAAVRHLQGAWSPHRLRRDVRRGQRGDRNLQGADTMPSEILRDLRGLAADWYLKLTGAATRMIRGEAPLSETIPESLPFPNKQ